MQNSTLPPDGHICIIGAGSIGVSFSIVFAKAGYTVKLVEPIENRRSSVRAEIEEKLRNLAAYNLLDSSCSEVSERIELTEDLPSAVPGALLVQECVPERRGLKNEIFRNVSELLSPGCMIASSSSAIPISDSAKGSGLESHAIVAHPGNPPHLIPVIELVPGKSTQDRVTRCAFDLYKSVGLSPVIIRQEIEGFVFNRLQGAVLREAYALVRDQIASVEDIDIVMRDGLGRRWSFMGPFETIDLNTRGGIASHARKMGPAYHRMGKQRGQDDPWTDDLVAQVVEQRRSILPLEDWEQKVAWRDQQLMNRLIAEQDVCDRQASLNHQPTGNSF